MSDPTQRQLGYLLQLANQLTGERAAYMSQSSVLPKSVRTQAEATALIDELKAAIEAEKKRQEETGLVIGARLRHRYVTGKGLKIIAEGEITGYKWYGTEVSELLYDATPETRAAGGFGESTRTMVVLERLGERVGDDDPQALKAERARLLARVAEIDAALAQAQ